MFGFVRAEHLNYRSEGLSVCRFHLGRLEHQGHASVIATVLPVAVVQKRPDLNADQIAVDEPQEPLTMLSSTNVKICTSSVEL